MLRWPFGKGSQEQHQQLQQVAGEIGPVLVRELLPQAREYYAALSARSSMTLSPQKLWELEIEDFFFCLNLLDRAILARIGPDHRAVFMDAVFASVCENIRYTYATEVPEAGFRQWLRETLNSRQREYGSWSFPSGDTLKGTLFWEFAKKTAFSIEAYNPVEIFLLSHRGADLLKGMFTLADEVSNSALKHRQAAE